MFGLIRGLASAVLGAALAIGGAQTADAARVALVVGNDGYKNLPALQKAKADAATYADFLRGQGFDLVMLKTDLAKAGMDEAIATFLDAIKPGDTAVFAYSGHGWSDGVQNYLVGTDAPKSGSQDLLARISVPLRNGVTGVLDDMERHGASLKVAIIDACRDNPFQPQANGRTIGVGRGLTRIDPPQGTFVVFSAGTGQQALDGLSQSDSNPNSVFTRVFAPLLKSGLSLRDATIQARQQVVALARSAGQDQLPAYYDEVLGDTYLGRTPAAVIGTGDAGLGATPDSIAAEYQAAAAIGTSGAWNLFLTKHSADPGNFYMQLAKEALQRLQQQALLTKPQTAPSVTGQSGGDMAEVVTECDRLAASPTDADKPRGVVGVPIDQMPVTSAAAIAACQAQLVANPTVRRFRYELGRAFSGGKNYGLAREAYEGAAAAGSAGAMNNLGLLYANGQGVAQDYVQARGWYEKALAGGSTAAMNNLGNLYANGQGVAQDYVQARGWYEKAAARGDAAAMHGIGLLYANGRGVAQDYVQARGWYEKAVAGGSTAAMNNLGNLYANGQGVAQDYVQARGWYEKAAARGDAAAMHGIGLLYANGRGVAQDYVQARGWYEKAVAGGSEAAMNNLGNLYFNGQGVAQDYVQARSWYEKGVAGGSVDGMYNLATLLDTSRGGSRDANRALQLYLQALSRSHSFSFEQLRTNSNVFSDDARMGIQTFLISKGYLEGAADGVFRASTIAALTAYQKSLAVAN